MRLFAFAAALLALAGTAAADKPVAVTVTEAIYPFEAWPQRVPGEARVRITVAADGYVDRVELLSETPAKLQFGREALDAARRWTFEPAHPGMVTAKIVFPVPDKEPEFSFGSLPQAPEPLVQAKLGFPAKALAGLGQGHSGIVRIALQIGEDGVPVKLWPGIEFPPDLDFADAAQLRFAKARYPAGQPGLYRTDAKFLVEGREEKFWASFPTAPRPAHDVSPVFPTVPAHAEIWVVRMLAVVGPDGVTDPPVYIDVRDEGGKPAVDELGAARPVLDAFSDAFRYWRFSGTAPGLYRLDITVPPAP